MIRIDFNSICSGLSEKESSIIILAILESMLRRVLSESVDFIRLENIIINAKMLLYSKNVLKDKKLVDIFSRVLELESIEDLVSKDEKIKVCSELIHKVELLLDTRINDL